MVFYGRAQMGLPSGEEAFTGTGPGRDAANINPLRRSRPVWLTLGASLCREEALGLAEAVRVLSAIVGILLNNIHRRAGG